MDTHHYRHRMLTILSVELLSHNYMSSLPNTLRTFIDQSWEEVELFICCVHTFNHLYVATTRLLFANPVGGLKEIEWI